MRSLTPHVKVRWYWLLLAAAVAANVYGFVGFPNLTDPEMSEAAAHPSTGAGPHRPPPPAVTTPPPPARRPCWFGCGSPPPPVVTPPPPTAGRRYPRRHR